MRAESTRIAEGCKPAFPTRYITTHEKTGECEQHGDTGLTKREHIAALIFAHSWAVTDQSHEAMAQEACKAADALLRFLG